jgi:hypothetical protein
VRPRPSQQPSFAAGKGLSVHIRTTRVNYYSYIESVAVRIGDEVLQFDNDVDNFLLNGEVAPPQEKWVNQYLSEDYHIVRYKKAVSIRLDESSKANIDLIRRTTGFPTVRITAGSNDDILKGSTGLLGEYGTGRTVGRDGATVFEINGVADEEGATAFALEWQVRPNEDGMIFKEARFPQYPEAKCTPPKKQSFLSKRLGSKHMEEIARDACKGWKLEDIDDCIFDVIATRDVAVAAEAGAGDEEFVMYEGVEEI